MKNYFKFVLAVVIFTASFIFTSQETQAKGKIDDVKNFRCEGTDGQCATLSDGTTLFGRCICL